MNKKILISFLLVVLIALTLGSVSAQDATDVDDVVAVDDSEDIVEVDDSSEVVAETYTPVNDTVEAVQEAVNSANKSGDIVSLKGDSIYYFNDTTVTVSNSNIVINGNDAQIIGYGNGNGIFNVVGSNITFKNIQFIDNNPKNNFTYNGTVSGYGIRIAGTSNVIIEDCTFKDFSQAVRIQSGATDVIIRNNEFIGGYATKLINDPTVNKEEGSKVISIMGSSRTTIIGNKFTGPMLDAISIAGGSGYLGSNIIRGNTFEGNVYSIYFGGSSTNGTILADNIFINCGSFEDEKQGIDWDGFPVISIQKSSDGISIDNNTFYAIDNNILIAGEAGNAAHGYPSVMGNINVTANTVLPYASTMDNVTLFHILVRNNTAINITTPIVVAENTLNGATGVSIWMDGLEIFTADNAVLNDTLDANHIYSGKTLYGTSITPLDVTFEAGASDKLYILLTDSNGISLANKEITVIIDGVSKTVTTDADGNANLTVSYADAGIYYATVIFAGEGNLYKSSVATAKITVTAKPAPVVVKKDTTLTAKKATLKVKKAKKVKVTLKSEGKAVSGKQVTIKVNKKTFKAKTNAKGVATIKVKVTKKGKFNAVVSFAGDNDYNSVSKKVKYTVKK